MSNVELIEKNIKAYIKDMQGYASASSNPVGWQIMLRVNKQLVEQLNDIIDGVVEYDSALNEVRTRRLSYRISLDFSISDSDITTIANNIAAEIRSFEIKPYWACLPIIISVVIDPQTFEPVFTFLTRYYKTSFIKIK